MGTFVGPAAAGITFTSDMINDQLLYTVRRKEFGKLRKVLKKINFLAISEN